MDIKMQYLLRKNRQFLLDIDVDDILGGVISSNTLTDEDIELIKTKTTRTDKTNTLLDIVLKNGPPCYIGFVDSLFKPYYWLWEKMKITNTDLPIEMQKDILADILHHGNVPKLPIHYVKRESIEKELHDHLMALERYKTLTLHGMSGSGKTSLVISTLRSNSDLIINKFNGKVFWISVGDCMTDDQIFQLQSSLLRRIQKKNPMNMSASGSLDFSDYSILVDQDWKEYRTKLIEEFNEDLYKEALIVIDDPKNKQIIEAFDLGCKLLVITQDSSVVEDSIIYKLNCGLSEEESMKLISMSINQDVNKLPDEARKMHRICHGTPLLMAMLGGLLADNKDSLKHNKSKWKSFLKQLKNKPTFLERVSSRENSKDNTSICLEMGINSLENDDMKAKYKSLAILPENIKVSDKALAVILNMTEDQVNDFMVKLEKKSLITKHYNVDRDMYEYEINDLIMSHLKHIHSQNDFKRLHAQLIKRYLMKCPDNSLVNLPDDGYIAYYIGYHILKTDNLDEMWELFGLLYTNLEFIGNKIRLAGPFDTIEDLKTYSKYIYNYSKNADEFIRIIGKFISNYGHDLHYYPYTNILQSVMQYEPSGILFDKASSLAKKDHNLDHVYFQFLPNIDCENNTVFNIGSEISFIKLWWEYVFVGHTDGLITLWVINDEQKIKTFYGHKAAIKCISINSQSPCRMGSVCNDGVVKIWNVNDYLLSEQDSSSEAEDEISTTHDTHNSDFSFKHESGPYDNIVWDRKHDIILCHTNPGNMIVIHNLKKGTFKEITCEECIEIKCSLLSYDNSLAIVGYNHRKENQFGINLYCIKTGNRMMTFTEQSTVLNLILLPDDPRSVIVLTNKYVHKHKWKKVVLTDSDQAKDNVIHSKIIELDKESKYEFCMMKLGSDNVIFVSTTDCRILIYNINRSDLLCELNNHRGIISLMDYMEYKTSDNNSLHLLITAGGVDQTYAKLWFVNDPQFQTNSARKTPKFDCLFDGQSILEKPTKVSPSRETSEGESPVRRVKTLSNGNKSSKPSVCKTTSLDRQTLKNLNLQNLSRKCSDNDPLVAIIDSSRCVQVLKGNTLIAKTKKASSNITCVALSPCGRYLIYGLEKGEVMNFMFKSMCNTNNGNNVIMEINDCVNYIEFINSNTVAVAGRNCSLMVYEIVHDDFSKSKATMLTRSFQELGSQEILDIISGKKKSPTLNSKNSSYSSTESIVSLCDNDSPDFVKSPSKYSIMLRRSPTIKCFIIENIGMLSVELNGCVKFWDMKYQLSNVLIKNEDTQLTNYSARKEDLRLTCVCVQKNHLIMCDKLGNFRIYIIKISNSPTPLIAKIVTSHRISQNIVSCAMSHDEKYLAMGCTSGNIVLWDVTSRILISIIHFHKEAVHSLIFSPTPTVTQPISDAIVDDCNQNKIDKNSTPLVLVSLSGQICWWDITFIINKKINRLRDRKRVISHIETLISSSPISAQSLSSNNGNSCTFEFNTDSRWEKLWKNKKSKNTKRKELLNCVKLKGERAFKILANNTFSTFVTIDQGGVMHIMKMFNNNEAENGFAQNNHLS